MRLYDKLLLFLLKPHAIKDPVPTEWNPDKTTAQFRRAFPGFVTGIEGKRILDFGCGSGELAAALAELGAAYVLGLDTNPRVLHNARNLAGQLGIGSKIDFVERLDESRYGGFDIVISQNSMEHFNNPEAVLQEMKSVLAYSGNILITFGPPWFAPYGSHMRFLTWIPWVNIIFPERIVMKARSRLIYDNATRYEEVEGGLNRMTVRRFERIIEDCGLVATYRKYNCVKGINFLGRLPVIKELFINAIDCVLADTANVTQLSRENLES